MLKYDAKRQNIFFVAFISISTAFLAGFIILAMSLILIRGFPELGASLMTREIQFAIKLSFLSSVSSTLLCIFFAIPVAYGLARFNYWGKTVLNIALAIPMALPPLVSGLALVLLFGTTAWGHAMAAWGLQVVFTPLGIVIAQFFVNVPYMVRIIKTTIEDIDPRLEFVARTLGGSRLKSFFAVTLPLARNGLIAGIVITWARALGEFGAALLLAGATRMKTETLPVALYLNMSTGDIDLALVAATILIIIAVTSLSVFEILGGRKVAFSRKNSQERW